MQVVVAEPAGFCSGVRRALRLALEAAGRGGAVTLGSLVHNPAVLQWLEQRGVKSIDSLRQAKGRVVVVRSHGAPPQVYREAEALGVELVDATCPRVRKVQERAQALAQGGDPVIVVGDRGHPEVEALVGWAGPNCLVVSGPEEVEGLPRLQRAGVVAQTTQRPDRVEEVLRRLKDRVGELRSEVALCSAAAERQAAARRLAAEAELVIVVGGRESANARNLLSLCREAGREAHQVERPEDLKAEWFRGQAKVGVLAGASTPDWMIKEVLRKMEEIRDTEKLAGGGEPAEQEAAGGGVPAGGEGVAAQPKGAEAEERPEVRVRPLRPGDVVKGRVVALGQDNVLVDVGHKSEGVVPLWELSHRRVQSPDEVVKPGDEINVYVLAVEGPEGVLRLSKKRADEEVAWRNLEDAFQSGRIIEAPVTEEVKGGLIVDVGIRGFMPASHVERGYVSDLSQYVGRRVRVRVIELDRHKNRVILSQKVVLEEEYQRLREETWRTVAEGQRLRGVVKSITDFGAFVDIGGVDGLLHVSEMSWGRVNHPSEVVKEGETIEVVVLRVDREKEKISLGLKQALPDPWADADVKYPAGSLVKGKVVRVVGFGAFVQLEPGVEGLVHISQLANRRVATPEEVVAVGDEIRVKVLRVSPKERRISLSLKEAEHDQEKAVMREYMTTEDRRESVTLGEVFGDLLEETRGRIEEKPAAKGRGRRAPAVDRSKAAAEGAKEEKEAQEAPLGQEAAEAGAGVEEKPGEE
ncbi:MAG: bifunctional 4-hydroxy-3-methylbut-2-enyl diphosphate reductase/30S ribosomal protein S1 [Acetobacteraceae bacterium]|nr:bifunctional 4-hydroxy-3-methylbut-2-enyl diphosphate reductase/30S ribosomal protein S1 [Acetobacteraceae bacterium]